MKTIIDGTEILSGQILDAIALGDPVGLIDDLSALVMMNQRSFAGIIPHVVIEEAGDDELRITDHPVEVGAAITDHAFKMPVVLVMKAAWSDSTAGAVGYVRRIYDQLIALQADREPFDIVSGKRLYKNMLMGGISQATDHKSEFSLQTIIRFREVILTYTTLEGGGAKNGTTPQNDRLPAPLSTSAVQFGQIAGITSPSGVGMMQPIIVPGGPSSSTQFGRIGGVT